MTHDVSHTGMSHSAGRGTAEWCVPAAELKWAGFLGTALETVHMVIYSTATATVLNRFSPPSVTPANGFLRGFGTDIGSVLVPPRKTRWEVAYV